MNHHRSPLKLAGNPANVADASTLDGSVIVNRITYQAAPDELVVVVTYAKARDIEPGALLRTATRAGVVVKIGRQAVARRSDLLALVEILAKPKAAPVSTDAKAAYEAFVKGGHR